MGDAKRIVVRPIDRQSAEECIRRWHYSGKGIKNAQLHLGAFLDGRLLGAMQFGPSLDKQKLQGLVEGTGWFEFIELNRMAFSDALPRNSESRCLSIAMLLLRKHAPQVKWIVSYADATQCGDGTIYRASGFILTGIKRNATFWQTLDGNIFSTASKSRKAIPIEVQRSTGVRDDGSGSVDALRAHARPMQGYQLRYVYFLDPTYRARLTVPELSFQEIDRIGARMYRGKRAGTSTRSGTPAAVGGATPTPALHRVIA